MAYRSVEYEANSFKPAKMMLGRKLPLLLELVTVWPPNEELTVATGDYTVELRQRNAPLG